MNFKSRIIIGCLLGACTLQVSAEKTYKYRINLRDKAETAYSVGSPQAYLSERALERRERQGLKVGCPEEIGYRLGFIDAGQLEGLAAGLKNAYGEYLREVLRSPVF